MACVFYPYSHTLVFTIVTIRLANARWVSQCPLFLLSFNLAYTELSTTTNPHDPKWSQLLYLAADGTYSAALIKWGWNCKADGPILLYPEAHFLSLIG